MNIKNFLIENYIWILIVILLTIITIIGFLVDKKIDKKKAKKETTIPQASSIQQVPPQGSMQYQNQVTYQQPIINQQPMQTQQQPINNNMAMNYTTMNTPTMQQNQTQPVMNYQYQQVEPISIEPVGINFGTINNPQPVEQIQPVIEQEPMYQPLSEQTPVFAPKEVPNYNTPNIAPMQNNQPIQTNQTNMIYNQPNTMMESNIQQSTQNFIPEQNTVPQPVEQMQPLVNNNYQNPNPNMTQQNPYQQVQNSQGQPINFVYGQQNNNMQ